MAPSRLCSDLVWPALVAREVAPQAVWVERPADVNNDRCRKVFGR